MSPKKRAARDWRAPAGTGRECRRARELTRLHHRARTHIAAELQPLHEPVHVDRWPGAIRRMARRTKSRGGSRCRTALTVVRINVGSRRPPATSRPNAVHALGNDLGVGSDAVLWDRVPCWEGNDAHLGIEKGERCLQRIEPPIISRDVKHESGPPVADAASLREARKHQRVEPLGHAGQDQIVMNARIHSTNRRPQLAAVGFSIISITLRSSPGLVPGIQLTAGARAVNPDDEHRDDPVEIGWLSRPPRVHPAGCPTPKSENGAGPRSAH